MFKKEPNFDAFWPSIDIDLSGAKLFDFDFSYTNITKAKFDSGIFIGRTSFQGAAIGHGSFQNANFASSANFYGCAFTYGAVFSEAKFAGEADFSQVTFWCCKSE